MYIRFKSEQEIDKILSKGKESSSAAKYWRSFFWKYCNKRWRLDSPKIKDISKISYTYPLRYYPIDTSNELYYDFHKDYLEYIDEPNDILSSEAITSITKLLKELDYETTI